MDLRHPFEQQEPTDRLLHRSSHRQRSVITEQDRLGLPQGGGDPLAGVEVRDLDFLTVEYGVVLEEGRGLLADHPEVLHVGGPGRGVGGVGMGDGHHFRPGFMHRGVDVVGGHVDGMPAIHPSVRPYQDKVGDRRPAKGYTVADQPHRVGALRVAGCDVPVAQRTPPEGAEQPVGGYQHPFSMRAQLFGGLERGLGRYRSRSGVPTGNPDRDRVVHGRNLPCPNVTKNRPPVHIRSSAISTALRAAPLRRLSPTTHRLIPPGSPRVPRMREARTGSAPAESSGVAT